VSYVNKERTYTCEDITHCKPQIYLKKMKIIHAHMYVHKSYAKIHIQLLGFPEASSENSTLSMTSSSSISYLYTFRIYLDWIDFVVEWDRA
jgi:hypothetical protein